MKTQGIASLIFRLKQSKRKGWLDRGLKADSIAEHTYGAMLLGWLISSEEKADVNKVVQMLLVHDLVMAKMTDVTPSGGNYEDKREIEEKAKRVISGLLPINLRKTYIQLFDEFSAQKTLDSKVAREADKLETLFQGEAFEMETGRSDILDEFLKTYQTIFTTKSGKDLYEEIALRHNTRK